MAHVAVIPVFAYIGVQGLVSCPLNGCILRFMACLTHSVVFQGIVYALGFIGFVLLFVTAVIAAIPVSWFDRDAS